MDSMVVTLLVCQPPIGWLNAWVYLNMLPMVVTLDVSQSVILPCLVFSARGQVSGPPLRRRLRASKKLRPKDGVPHVPDLQTSLAVLPSPPLSHGVPSRLRTFWQLPFLQVLETVHCFWRPLRLQSTLLVLHWSSPTHSPLPASV